MSARMPGPPGGAGFPKPCLTGSTPVPGAMRSIWLAAYVQAWELTEASYAECTRELHRVASLFANGNDTEALEVWTAYKAQEDKAHLEACRREGKITAALTRRGIAWSRPPEEPCF